MDILVSFCAAGLKRGFSLGAMDANTLSLRQVMGLFRLNERVQLELTGLAADSRFVYVAGRRPAILMVLDRNDLCLIQRHEVSDAIELHSLCLHKEELYVVSTGTDEVLRLKMRGPHIESQSVHWRPEPDSHRGDYHHLNGICVMDGDLVVTGFGKRNGGDWLTAGDGFAYNIDRGEYLARGLDHPHSPLVLDAGLAYCESGSYSLHLPGRPQVADLPGFTRGLCSVGGHLFVATSSGRLRSRSTGKLNRLRGKGPLGRCTVRRIGLQSGAVELEADLSWHGGEIYDLLPLD